MPIPPNVKAANLVVGVAVVAAEEQALAAKKIHTQGGLLDLRIQFCC